MALKCLVFDCDGVILDSVPVKTRAFARLVEPYGREAQERMVDYHVEHGGVSRFLKFDWFFHEVLGRDISPQERQDWGKKFEELALDEVRKCPLMPGVRETLQRWHGVLPMYVCSGAPAMEVYAILEERGLAGFFEDIACSPPEKQVLLGRIIHDAHVPPGQTLMVGDASTDREAAKANGTLFYGIGEAMASTLYPWSVDLYPLNSWIERHLNS